MMFPKRVWNLCAAAILAVVLAVAAVIGLWAIWDWLQGDGESNGETLRNIALVLAAVIALPLALWRSLVAQRQADTAQRGLLNERYQKGAEMLGSSILSVRLGGIHALRSLAEEHPQQYAAQILRLFCAFARYPTGDAEKEPDNEVKKRPRADIQAVMEAIGAHDKLLPGLDTEILDLRGADLANISLVDANLYGAKLSEANLCGVELYRVNLSQATLSDANLSQAVLSGANLYASNLERANLSGASLSRANFSYAYLNHADLSGAKLFYADLTCATLDHANLSEAVLSDTNLTSARLIGVKGITQIQLDMACADPRRPPKWWGSGIQNANTNKPLIWRGQPVEDGDCKRKDPEEFIL